ncbi:MAG: membrane protein insertase YidC [Elusimicrobiota bacterium]
MEKKTFLAIVLSLVILVVWQWAFKPKSQHIDLAQSTQTIQTTSTTDKIQQPSQIRAENSEATLDNSAIESKKPAKTFQIETDEMIYTLSEDEASITSCLLKENRLNKKTTVELVLNGKLANDKNTGNWLSIISQKDRSHNICPPVVEQICPPEFVGQAKFLKRIHEFDIEKTFYFKKDSNFVDIKYSVLNKTKLPKSFNGLTLSIGPGLGTDVKELKENNRLLRAILYSTKKAEKLKVGDYQFVSKWAGIDNRYFLSVFLRTNDDFKNIKVETSEKIPSMEIFTGKIDFLPFEKKLFSIIYYTGPKGYANLKGMKLDGLNPQLEKAVDFGFFSDLGEIALFALNYIYKFTNNYGWAIFIISVILNIISYPLSKKSFTSSQKMKSVQEEIKILQMRYKGDPKKLNTETWALYKAKGVNPLSGCLPMLVQLPIFWALFTMLRNAYELRGAHFIFWITDLSAKDPYYILPILMGGGMFLQQWMSTNTADPTQKQMMIMMPIIFTVMFLGFPSGLVIYWLTNSIVTVLEQWLIFSKGSSDKKNKNVILSTR